MPLLSSLLPDRFPNRCPSKRSFKQGTFPQKQYRGLSGAVSTITFGNKPTGYELSLEYTAVSNEFVLEIMQHYINSEGGVEGFSVPPIVWVGLDDKYTTEYKGSAASVEDYIRAPDGIRWRYAEPPQVESVLKNRQTVTVLLIGGIIAA